ncbi:MAG: GC-type dockerin domain-anchored protein [Phycisphaerales bacterium JB059]
MFAPTFAISLAAGIASSSHAQSGDEPARFVRGLPVAQIRVNLATGERTVHPWNAQHRSDSPPVWINDNTDPCLTGITVGLVDDPDVDADGFGDLFGSHCDGTSTFPCEGNWSNFWGDLHYPDTVIDRVHFMYGTGVPDVDLNSDGVGDGVPGLTLYLNFADHDNGFGAHVPGYERQCIIELEVTDLPGAVGNLPPGFGAVYELVIDLAQDSPSLVFELGDSDGIDDAGTGYSGAAIHGQPTFIDLDSNLLHDFSWGVRFDQSAIPQAHRGFVGWVSSADKFGNIGDTPPHPADAAGLHDNADNYANGPSCPPEHPADYIGTFFFAGFTCHPGLEVPFFSTHLELYGHPAPVPPHPGCNPADCAEPLGTLDFADVVAFLTAFGSFGVYADLAEPVGTLDFADVIAFLTAFGQGCP